MKIRSLITIILFFIVFILLTIYTFHVRNENKTIYNRGVILLEDGDYSGAINEFEKIPDYINYGDIQDLLLKYEIKDVCPYCGVHLK